jgi:hypothetical protein
MLRLATILSELTPHWMMRRAVPLPPEGLPSPPGVANAASDDPHDLARRADRQWARCVENGLYGASPSVRRH